MKDKYHLEIKSIIDFLNFFEKNLIDVFDDFSRIDIDKLNELHDLIIENIEISKNISNNFSKNLEIFENKFKHFTDNFQNISLAKREMLIEDFLNDILILKKEILNLS
jgi:hypothetical protein